MIVPEPKPRPPLPEGPYLVVGLARSGSAIARVLAERGAEVIGCDSGAPEEAQRLGGSGVEVHMNVDGTMLVDRARCVVKSPGVPAEAPVVGAAWDRGVLVIGELEAAWRMLPNRFIGVTGTNGKTTVTELIGHIYHRAAPAAVAGNVGTPVASLVGAIASDATVVCECSSFQLEDTEAFSPECAVFLNFAPDHLDRHPTLDDYLKAKLMVFANQDNEDLAVYNAGDPAVAERDLGGCARRVAYCRTEQHEPSRPRTRERASKVTGDSSASERKQRRRRSDVEPCAVSLAEGTIFWGEEPLVEADRLRLLGEHNVDNAMAAAAACLAMGIAPRDVRDGLITFPGVPHRLEPVAEIAGTRFVNDSKATNVAAAAAALRSFDGGVHAILGGSPKGESFEALADSVAESCVACYLIGQAADRLERELGRARSAGVELRRCEGLEDAVRGAARAAGPGEVVLLAPACASFDAYRDFEQRGEHFRSIVESLR